MSLMMLTSCTSTVGVRCDGRLSPINAPVLDHKHAEASVPTSGMTTQEVEP